jgi:hypothetical protein
MAACPPLGLPALLARPRRGVLGEASQHTENAMRMIAAIAALSALLIASPAHAQEQDVIMKALDFGVLREVSKDLGYTLTDEGVDEDGQYYLELQAESGLVFYAYGNGCSDADAAKECLGLNLVTTFTVNDTADIHEVMDSVSYAFMKVYLSGGDIKASRYLIFDGGITRANMQENVTVFVQIADAIWKQLAGLDVLEE